MAIKVTIILGILTFIHSTFGGFLHGVTYSAISSPNNYNSFGRIAAYSSPIIANPSVDATYSTTRYTAYAAVPLTASVATNNLVPRQQHVGGFVRTFAAPSLSRHHFGISNSLFRQQGAVSAYAAVPIAGYRASFGGPSSRSYGASVKNFPAAFNFQGLYPSNTASFDDYANPIVEDQRTFQSFENENPLSAW